MNSSLGWFPRIMCFAECHDDAMIYFSHRGQVEIRGHVTVQQALLHVCTGHNSAEEIIELLKPSYDSELLIKILNTLREEYILVDSGNCWQNYHEYGTNPMEFYYPPTEEQLLDLHRSQPYQKPIIGKKGEFLKLLCSRESIRDFSGEAIDTNEILSIAYAGYGITGELEVMGVPINRRTVPSAGALYSLELHVIIRQASKQDNRGVYVFNGTHLNKIREQFEDQAWQQCFLDDAYVKTHCACFVISGNIERQTAKYADRGYRYTILEAGHAAQNIIIACTELGVGCVEVGGFFDREITQFLSLSSSVIPITTILVGSNTKKGG